MLALIWGHSSYTTDDDERRMVARLDALGVGWHKAPPTVEPPEALARAQILVVHSKARVTEALLERAPALRLVITTTSGYDNIDLPATRARGARVARCPMARRDAVIDTSVGMALSLIRDVPGLHARATEGVWARPELATRMLRRTCDLTVGIIGGGVIGTRAGEVWSALGARVLVSDPALAGSPGFDEVARQANILTLHCSLTPASHRLIRAETLALMPPGAILVNTARGACVDVEALSRLGGHLGGIALDVFPQEPWPGLQALAQRQRVLLTPHAAGYHDGLGQAIAEELGDTIEALVAEQALPHEVL